MNNKEDDNSDAMKMKNFKVRFTTTSVYEATCIASSTEDAENKILQGEYDNINFIKDQNIHENIEIEKI